ncbi:MAG: hypothetical protein NT178_08415 [Proteobacteria bacterium]|nr:hypothetical protein [Pseudomonadota bacterium]
MNLKIPVNRMITKPNKFDEFYCTQCQLSINRLKEMAEVNGSKEMFTTLRGNRWMNIYEITDDGFLIMRRSTGKLTWKLDLHILFRVHDLVHEGAVDLDSHEIDSVEIDDVKKVTTWGGYIAALLKHLKCNKVTKRE